MHISIELSDKELEIANQYAKSHGLSLSQAFKKALFETIEDEYDSILADEAYKEYLANGKKSRPIEYLWKEADF